MQSGRVASYLQVKGAFAMWQSTPRRKLPSAKLAGASTLVGLFVDDLDPVAEDSEE
jgi:hypothetical protein